MDFLMELRKRRWQMTMIALLALGLITNGCGTVFANTMADISGGSVAADGSWHGDGKVKITAGSSFTNDADIYSSKDYCAGMQLKMNGGQIGGSIYGGWSDELKKRVYSNAVEITGGKVLGDVYGGWAKKEWANGNLVEIANGAVIGAYPTNNGMIYGGYSVENEASHNIVNCNGFVAHFIFGGYGDKSANENHVTLGDGCCVQEVYSGWSNNGSADKNTIEIYDNNIKNVEAIYGGKGLKGACGNKIIAENINTGRFVGGESGRRGDTSLSKADYNKVTLVNSNGGALVTGGYNLSSTGSANYNEVTIENSNLSYCCGANSLDEASGNKLNIKNCNFSGSACFGVAGGKQAVSNSIIVDGAKFDRFYNITTLESQKINDNFLYFKNTNASVFSVISKTYNSYGEQIGGINAEGNKTFVLDSSFEYWSGIGGTYGCGGDTVFLKNNEFTISNTSIKKDMSMFGSTIYNTGGEIENNTLRLIGKDGCYQDITGGPVLFAGDVYCLWRVNDLIKTRNNNLEIYGKNIKFGNIHNFDNIYFHLADNAKANDVIVTATTEETMDLSNTAVNVEIGKSKLCVGDKIILIKLSDGRAKLIYDGSKKAAIQNGPFAAVGYTIAVDKAPGSAVANDLIMTVEKDISSDNKDFYDYSGSDKLLNEFSTNMKSIAETRANAAALADESIDFLMDSGLSQAKAAAKANVSAGEGGFAPFAVFGGSDMRYKTGSHIDSRSWHGAIGMAKQIDKLTFGLAIDYGRSRYDSYMDNGTHGNGKSKATGANLFAEFRKNSGVHFDASVGAGRLKNDYSAILSDYPTNYEESSNYFSLSFGLGQELNFGSRDKIDTYGRIYYNHLGNSNTNIYSGLSEDSEAYFDGLNSTRLRLGARYIHSINEQHSLYTGLAYQYEFSGKAKVTIDGNNAPAPSLKGNSCMAEVGYNIEKGRNLSVDFNVNGWTGKKKGVAGNVSLQWSF